VRVDSVLNAPVAGGILLNLLVGGAANTVFLSSTVVIFMKSASLEKSLET
jgi:hypothetical protein